MRRPPDVRPPASARVSVVSETTRGTHHVDLGDRVSARTPRRPAPRSGPAPRRGSGPPRLRARRGCACGTGPCLLPGTAGAGRTPVTSVVAEAGPPAELFQAAEVPGTVRRQRKGVRV